MTRTDLLAAAFKAQELDQPLTASVVAGGFGNGRAESRITIGRALVRGQVALQQGLTPDWIYVSPDAARTVVVELE